MRFLIVSTDYPDFLRAHYAQHRDLEHATYAEQLAARNESLFGMADFYSFNLRQLGHEAEDVHANNEPLQRAWAREHGLRVPAHEPLGRRAVRRLRLSRVFPGRSWVEAILAEQVERARPDVLLVQDMISLYPRFLRTLRGHVGLLVGQHAAAPLQHDAKGLHVYDLVLSSFQPTVDALRAQGVAAALHRLGFEPRVLEAVPERARSRDVTFVGSLFPGLHDSRIRLLEQLGDVFGERLEIHSPHLPESPKLRPLYRGPAYGRAMYAVLRESKVTVNEHGSIAPYANNCRLYEATGVGAALVTDLKPNVGELLEPEHEALTFSTPDECVRQVATLLDDRAARERVGAAGQARTLRDHTYGQRMRELVELVEAAGSTRRAA